MSERESEKYTLSHLSVPRVLAEKDPPYLHTKSRFQALQFVLV